MFLWYIFLPFVLECIPFLEHVLKKLCSVNTPVLSSLDKKTSWCVSDLAVFGFCSRQRNREDGAVEATGNPAAFSSLAQPIHYTLTIARSSLYSPHYYTPWHLVRQISSAFSFFNEQNSNMVKHNAIHIQRHFESTLQSIFFAWLPSSDHNWVLFCTLLEPVVMLYLQNMVVKKDPRLIPSIQWRDQRQLRSTEGIWSYM